MSFVEREMFIGPENEVLYKLREQIFLALSNASFGLSYPVLRAERSSDLYHKYFDRVTQSEIAEEIKKQLVYRKCEVVVNIFPYDKFESIRDGAVTHVCLWWDSKRNEMTNEEIVDYLKKYFGPDASIYFYENPKEHQSVGCLTHVQVFVVNNSV